MTQSGEATTVTDETGGLPTAPATFEQALKALREETDRLNTGPALLQASRAGNLAGIQTALDNGADKSFTDDAGNSAAHFAAQSGARDVVQFMIAQKFPTDLTNNAGFTPLTFAVSGAHVDILNDLADAGGNVNHATPDLKETLLMSAAYRDAPALVAALLKAGAAFDSQDTNGVSAFMRAAGQNNTDCLQMLMEAGANPYLTSKTSRTAYDFAKRTRAEAALSRLDAYIPAYTARTAHEGQAQAITPMKKLALRKPDYIPLA